MTWDDRSYYRRRAAEEDLAAFRATSEIARDRHAQLAAMYRQRAGGVPGDNLMLSAVSSQRQPTAA